jgi:hypothetical protein
MIGRSGFSGEEDQVDFVSRPGRPATLNSDQIVEKDDNSGAERSEY